MLTVHNFAYGAFTLVPACVMSVLGAFLGLRSATRAQAHQGLARIRWLLLAAISIGALGIWAMHFIAMLGFAVPGETIRYSVPVTLLSMLVAVAVVSGGLLIAGTRQGPASLVLAGTITGLGVASMHYTGMAAMRMPARMSYDPKLLALSVIIAIVAATAAFWAARSLRGALASLGAAMIMGVAVSGMHYTGMAAMRVWAPPPGVAMATGGASAWGLLLPLIIGILIAAFALIGIIALAPTEAEIREDAALLARSQAISVRAASYPDRPLWPAEPVRSRPASSRSRDRFASIPPGPPRAAFLKLAAQYNARLLQDQPTVPPPSAAGWGADAFGTEGLVQFPPATD